MNPKTQKVNKTMTKKLVLFFVGGLILGTVADVAYTNYVAQRIHTWTATPVAESGTFVVPPSATIPEASRYITDMKPLERACVLAWVSAEGHLWLSKSTQITGDAWYDACSGNWVSATLQPDGFHVKINPPISVARKPPTDTEYKDLGYVMATEVQVK